MQGLFTKDERFLQLIPEATPGTYAGGTPVIASDAKYSFNPDKEFDEFDPDGFNDADFASLISNSTQLEITEFVPYYNLLDDLFLQFLFSAPANSTASNVLTSEYRWPQTGRRDVKAFSAEEGVAASARRALFGFFTSWQVESQAGRGGKVRGQASARLRGFSEGNTMAGQGAASEVQTLTVTDVPSGNAVNVVSGANNGNWTPSSGAAGLQATLQGLASIGAGNVAVAGALAQGTSSGTLTGTLTITFQSGKANVNMPQITSGTSGVTTNTTTQGSANASVSVAPVPVLPQHFSIYRSDTLAGLGNAANRIDSVQKWNVNIADIAAEWNAHNRSTSFRDFAQQKGTRMTGFNLPTDIGDHCSALLANGDAYTSTPQWFRYHAQSPLAPYEWIIDIYAAIHSSTPISYNGVIEERAFALRSMINRTDGFNFRMITKRPV